MNKNLLKLVLLTALCGVLMPIWALTPNGSGVYELKTKQDVIDFAALVNAGTTSANAVLKKDIDMAHERSASACWNTPIGTVANPYKGVFDGQGHTLFNFCMYMKDNSALQALQAVGLFGATSGATIKNVSVSSSLENNFEKNSSTQVTTCMGILVGLAGGTTIDNCRVNAGLFMNANKNVGGIVGAAGQSDLGDAYKAMNTITRCSNVGTWRIRNSGCYGGIVGYVYIATIENCYNAAVMTLQSDYAARIGGILGYANISANSRALHVNNCHNYGAITSTVEDAAKTPSLGALAGRMTGTEVYSSKFYYLGSSCAQAVGDLTSATTTESNISTTSTSATKMANGTTAQLLGDAFIKGEKYPVLAGQLHHGRLHRVGTYNIRYYNSIDTGDKAWSSRKNYVAKIVNDMDYDIIGFQEVVPGTQLDDLKSLLSDNYSLYFWGRDSESSISGEGTAIAYKKSQYTCLDKGKFFLNKDITKPSVSWDAALSRVAVWMKLQDKSSGEIIYFCSTHFDNQGDQAREEEARIVTEQMMQMGGSCPSVIVGDLNSRESRVRVHHRMMEGYEDAYQVSENGHVGPQNTVGSWSESEAEKARIDYVYVRRGDVLSYTANTEKYKRSCTPSDHYPVLCQVTFQTPDDPMCVYVSNRGNDETGTGSIAAPYATLAKAVQWIHIADTIKMAKGIYYPNANRSKYITISTSSYIIGGYDETFTSIAGRSEISGELQGDGVLTNNSERALAVKYGYSCKIQHVNFVDFYCSSAYTVGNVVYSSGYDFTMTNSDVMNCTTLGNGLIYATGKNYIKTCKFLNNTCGAKGVLYFPCIGLWKTSVQKCVFNNNAAQSSSVMFVSGAPNVYLANNRVVNNVNTCYGAVCVQDTLALNVQLLNNVFANNSLAITTATSSKMGGTALYVDMLAGGTTRLMNNTLVGNTIKGTASGIVGGAIANVKGNIYMYNNLVAGNYAQKGAGDVYCGAEKYWKTSQYNIYSAKATLTNCAPGSNDLYSSSAEAANRALISFTGGKLSESDAVYTALVSDDYVVVPFAKKFDGKAANVLTQALRAKELTGVDMDGTYLSTDCLGTTRNSSSMIGAVELGDKPTPSDLIAPSLSGEGLGDALKIIKDGQFIILRDGHVYTLQGNQMK